MVFTFCDEINPKKKPKPGESVFDEDYAHDWYNNALRKDAQGREVPGIPTIPKERIFFFKGEEGFTPETTTEEISGFITGCLPAADQATSVKNFSYTNYLKTAKESGNSELAKAAN